MIGKDEIMGKELRIEDTFEDAVLTCSLGHKKMIGKLVKVVDYHNNKNYVYVDAIEGDANRQLFPKAFIIDQYRNYDKSIEEIIDNIKEMVLKL